MISTEENKRIFRKRITSLRRNETLESAAERIGIGRTALGYYESGKRIPGIETLLKISHAYNVSCDYLLGLSVKKRADFQEGNGGDPMNDFKIRQIVDFFGDEPQIRQAMEECAELIVALNKYLRYKDEPKKCLNSKKNVIEEMADVYVMLRQLEYILCENGEIENLSDYKIDRTLKIISERRTEEER